MSPIYVSAKIKFDNKTWLKDFTWDKPKNKNNAKIFSDDGNNFGFRINNDKKRGRAGY